MMVPIVDGTRWHDNIIIVLITVSSSRREKQKVEYVTNVFKIKFGKLETIETSL